jgi:DNA polymerase-1
MSWLRDVVTIDFESLPIRRRPDFPPVPVGVAIDEPGRKPRYLAWGHLDQNNVTWSEARAELGRLFDSPRPLLFQNAKFDIQEAVSHFKVPWPDWRRVHDTLPMLFLDNPHAESYGLKAAAERLLGEPPGERDAVVDWLVDHQPVNGIRLTDNPRSKKNYAGAYVALAPMRLCGRYALGDVHRTKRIARKLYPDLCRRGMREAYELEMALLPYIAEMERQGVRVDLARLERDIERYTRALDRLDAWLRRRLGVGESMNLNSDAQLGEALVACGAADGALLGTNSKGYQVNKDALDRGVTDPQVLATLKYRAKLGTCLGTFMRPWAAVARSSSGLIFTEWHSTRREREGGTNGARTGRLSSTPNFQNLVKAIAALFREHDAQRSRSLPTAPIKGLPNLPLIRGYVVPYERDHALVGRDYSQQEFRLLGHYEGGDICAAYQRDPWVDFHELVQHLLNDKLGTDFERKPVKGINFGLLYGMGIGKLAAQAGTSVEKARAFKAMYMRTFPGISGLYAEMRRRAKNNEPIHTIGGREYYCEPPRLINGRLQTYDYKLPNILIQGGSGDITKRAARLYCQAKPRHHQLYFTVHDELTASVPRAERDAAMKLMRACMAAAAADLDVPMLSEGEWSRDNWASMKTYDKKGRRYAR